jgi:putative ABC transport system permease protein
MRDGLRRRLAMLFRRDRLDRELDEELRAHFDDLRRAFEDEGHAPAEAARLARLRLGGAAQLREASRDEWRLGVFEDVWQDARLAARGLSRRPGFSAAAIATLALGIGASTAIFSVAYGVSLRPLPYHEPDRLIRVYEANAANGQLEQDVSVGAFHDWREGAPSLDAAALFSTGSVRTVAGTDGLRLRTMSVSPAFFDVLGVRPLLGPGFGPEREYTRFTTDDVVLSHATWQRLFNGRPDVAGQPLVFTGVGDDDVMTVVGVMPEGFSFAGDVDVWLPQIVELPVHRMLRNWRYDRVVARLAPGATVERARAELEAIAARLAADFPASNAGWSVTVEPLRDAVIGDFGRATWLLLASVVVVLLVACLNVGGLLVARAVTRQRETAVRVALGAGGWRLLRLWLAETALLCVAGAGLGLLLAWLGVAALRAAAPPGIPRLDAIALDWPTLVVAALSTLVAAVVFTAMPMGRARRRDPGGALRDGSRATGDSRGRHTTRAALTVAQCAGAAMLVVLAVMLTRSLQRLTALDLGWDGRGVISVDAEPTLPPELRRPWYARVEWADRVIERLEATPGIGRAAIGTELPLGAPPFTSTLARGRGASAGDDARWPAVEHKVTDGYFDVMGIRLVAGRPFGPDDRFTEAQMTAGAPVGTGAAIVTEETARTLWPGESSVGRALWLPDIDYRVTWREVVGVIEDVQFRAVGEPPGLHVFLPWTQDSASARVYVMAKASAGDADAVAATARDVVRRVEPGAAVDAVRSLESLVERATAQPRFTSRLVAAFGALALILAAVGIYGTLAYLVGARTREIGIRLALGAPRRGIVSSVMRRGLAPALAGGVLGLAAALALARAFSSLLFDVEPMDLPSIAAGGAALIVVAIAAAAGPARRAGRVNPVEALKTE